MRMHAVAIVAALVLIEYMVFVWKTGQARGRHGVPAPAITGHPIFERWHRVQMNTVEQLVIFLPGLWLFATYVSAPGAAVLGVLFGVGRALFARGYVADPARRGPGFVLSYVSNAVLVLGGLVGAIASSH
jgi:glutathione S-transferase